MPRSGLLARAIAGLRSRLPQVRTSTSNLAEDSEHRREMAGQMVDEPRRNSSPGHIVEMSHPMVQSGKPGPGPWLARCAVPEGSSKLSV